MYVTKNFTRRLNFKHNVLTLDDLECFGKKFTYILPHQWKINFLVLCDVVPWLKQKFQKFLMNLIVYCSLYKSLVYYLYCLLSFLLVTQLTVVATQFRGIQFYSRWVNENQIRYMLVVLEKTREIYLQNLPVIEKILKVVETPVNINFIVVSPNRMSMDFKILIYMCVPFIFVSIIYLYKICTLIYTLHLTTHYKQKRPNETRFMHLSWYRVVVCDDLSPCKFIVTL